MQHLGLTQQLPTLRSIGLAFLVCLFGLSVFTSPVQAFQDAAGDEATVALTKLVMRKRKRKLPQKNAAF